MSKDSTLEAGARVPGDLNDLELVFGTPTSPRSPRPDVHIITNEHRAKEPTTHNNNNNNSSKPTDGDKHHPSLPLLEPDKGRPKPPLAGPEVDDLDDRPVDTNVESFHGIDDGLLDPVLPADKKPETFDHDDKEGKDAEFPESHDDGAGTEDDGVNSLGTRFGLDDRPISPVPGSIPDVNTYQQKKNLAQGMMDLALLSANANQLRYVIESSSNGHPYYYSSITFITLSIILQIAVGIGLIMNSRYNVKDEKDICKADKINNMTVLGIFLITIVNVFITSFSVAPTSTGIAVNVGGAVVQQAG